MFCVGQGIYGKARFADGQYPQYDRTYLVVSTTPDKIGILNISSTAGKEHKLLFPKNKHIKNYNPPFLKDSFAKLDSLIYVDAADMCNFRVLHHGDCLEKNELNEIIALLDL